MAEGLLLDRIMFEVFVSAVVSSCFVAVSSCFVLKNSWDKISLGRGLFLGLYWSIHSMRLIASLDALVTIFSNGIFG